MCLVGGQGRDTAARRRIFPLDAGWWHPDDFPDAAALLPAVSAGQATKVGRTTPYQAKTTTTRVRLRLVRGSNAVTSARGEPGGGKMQARWSTRDASTAAGREGGGEPGGRRRLRLSRMNPAVVGRPHCHSATSTPHTTHQA